MERFLATFSSMAVGIFAHKSKVRHWCQARRSGVQSVFQFTLKVFSVVKARHEIGLFHIVLSPIHWLDSSPWEESVLKKELPPAFPYVLEIADSIGITLHLIMVHFGSVCVCTAHKTVRWCVRTLLKGIIFTSSFISLLQNMPCILPCVGIQFQVHIANPYPEWAAHPVQSITHTRTILHTQENILSHWSIFFNVFGKVGGNLTNPSLRIAHRQQPKLSYKLPGVVRQQHYLLHHHAGLFH